VPTDYVNTAVVLRTLVGIVGLNLIIAVMPALPKLLSFCHLGSIRRPSATTVSEKLPAILALLTDTREVIYFTSLERAQAFIESYDVDEYEVFTADGCIVQISVNPPIRAFGSEQLVCLTATSESGAEKICSYLRDWLARLGQDVSAHMSLADAVRLLAKVQKPTD
jgi:hypothetical protein